MTKKTTFEDALKKLEKIVTKLEEGNLPLEESVKLFEEGKRLSQSCAKELVAVEKKVQKLLEDEKGQLRAVPFDAPEEESAQDTSKHKDEDEEEESDDEEGSLPF